MAKVMSAWRNIKGAAVELASEGIDRVWPALKKVGEMFSDAMGGSEGLKETMDDLRPALKIAGDVIMFVAQIAIPVMVKQWKARR